MITQYKTVLLSAFVFLFISACGGSSSEPSTVVANPNPQQPEPIPEPPQVNVTTGVFVDAEVQGLKYATDTQSGVTDAQGTFSYVVGESIVFSIGDIAFPAVLAKEVLSPLDIFNVTELNDLRVQNMARLLQTLDQDGIPGNGIVISDQAHNQAMGLSVDFASADFDSQVGDLVANAGALYTSLINGQTAIEHLTLSLDNLQNSGSCESSTTKQGQVGEFSNLAHNVSGFAKIIDNCTIEVTMFNFDGQAPNVRFYGGFNSTFTGPDAFGIGQRIDGRPYSNETIILRLPAGKTMADLDSLSVWCVEFNADFGNLVFAEL